MGLNARGVGDQCTTSLRHHVSTPSSSHAIKLAASLPLLQSFHSPQSNSPGGLEPDPEPDLDLKGGVYSDSRASAASFSRSSGTTSSGCG